jgi:trans-L-3-hydroxyproline dehydratase
LISLKPQTSPIAMSKSIAGMDIGYQGTEAISCVEMHTTGEPTRIIYSGFPKLQGALLEQRAQAKRQYDHLRRRVMLEPRGHEAMYGAILCQETELTPSNDADIGVLFIHNGGFSTMCGHATIALGRFLVDTHDLMVFPNRNKLSFDPMTQLTHVKLHAPCGLINVFVPTKPDGLSSDGSKPVSFISTGSFASALQIQIDIPQTHKWPELGTRTSVVADVGFGGTFHLIVSCERTRFHQRIERSGHQGSRHSNQATEKLIQ